MTKTNYRLPITDTVWQGGDLTDRYLNGVRGAIPLAQTQIDTLKYFELAVFAGVRPASRS